MHYQCLDILFSFMQYNYVTQVFTSDEVAYAGQAIGIIVAG